MLSERWQDNDWPSAIERDLMLAELRRVYESLLFADAQASGQPKGADAALTAEAAVTMVQMIDVAEDSTDIEPLDLEYGFDVAPIAESEPESRLEPEYEPETVPEFENGAEPAAEPEPELEPESKSESEPMAEPEVAPQAEMPAADSHSEVDAKSGTSETQGDSRKSLLFDLGTIQHRTHRRMMSLYDDDAFDRLPETPAAESVQAYQTPVQEEPAAEPEIAAPIAEMSESEMPESVAEPTDDVVAPSAETYAPAMEENMSEPETVYAEEETVVWSESEPESDTEDDISEEEPADDYAESDMDEYEPKEPMYEDVGDETTADTQSESPAAPAMPAAAQPQSAPAVLGDVMNSNVEVLGDTISAQASLGDTLAHAPVKGGLKSALDISERYQIIAELFGGDADDCDAAFEQLDAMESLEDAIIHIEENYRWNPSSGAAALVMDLLDRKFR